MNKNKIWFPILLMGVSTVLCVMAIMQSANSDPQRYPLFGLIPCLIGILSFLYVNKIAEQKTVFLGFIQIMNIAFMIFPLFTLLYFLLSL